MRSPRPAALLALLMLLLLPALAPAQTRAATFEQRFYFGKGKYLLDGAQTRLLDSLIRTWKLATAESIHISGYADLSGGDSINNRVSLLRALAVQEYLMAHGVSEAGISTEGKGANASGTPSDSDRKAVMEVVVKVAETRLGRTLARMRRNELLTLRKVSFVGEGHAITRTSIEELDELYQALMANPNVVVRIEAHLCCIGDAVDGYDGDSKTYDLSQNRAKAIQEYLVSKGGVDKARVKYIGYGGTRPLVSPEIYREDKETNKRIEIRIMSR